MYKSYTIGIKGEKDLITLSDVLAGNYKAEGIGAINTQSIFIDYPELSACEKGCTYIAETLENYPALRDEIEKDIGVISDVVLLEITCVEDDVNTEICENFTVTQRQGNAVAEQVEVKPKKRGRKKKTE